MLRCALAGILVLLACLSSLSPAGQETAPEAGPSEQPAIELEVGDAPERAIRGLHTASPGDQKVEAALERTVTLRCRDVRLDALAQEMERQLEIPVRLLMGDRPEERVDPGIKVTIEVYGAPLREALYEVDLAAFVIDKGKLVVIPDIPCRFLLPARVYPVGKLQHLGMQRLIELIKSGTSGPWDSDEPGTGTIQSIGDALVVRQTSNIHHEIEALLDMLVRADIKPAVETPKPVEAPAAGAGGGFF